MIKTVDLNCDLRDPALATADREAVCSVDSNLILQGLTGIELIRAGKSLGLFLSGSLFPRN